MDDYKSAESRQMASMLLPIQEKLKGYSITELCDKSGITFNHDLQQYVFSSMGSVINVSYPDYGIIQKLNMWHTLTLLQYMDTADGTALAGQWISLPEMRGGLSRGAGFDKDIAVMFQRYFSQCTSSEFKDGCLALAGTIVKGKGDVTAIIPYAPRFPVLLNFYEADDEFPASGKALVDANSEHYLTLEAAGGACSAVVQQIARTLGCYTGPV